MLDMVQMPIIGISIINLGWVSVLDIIYQVFFGKCNKFKGLNIANIFKANKNFGTEHFINYKRT